MLDGDDHINNEYKQNQGTVLISTEKGNTSKFVQLSILATMLVSWVVVIWYYSVHKEDYKSPPLYTVTSKRTVGRKLKLILFGDSLIQKPAEKYKLVEEIQKRLPGFTIVNSGKNGEHLDELQARVNRDVVQKRPDLVFLFWDSDMSATPLSILNSKNFQVSYTQQTIQLILSIKNVTDVIVSGPVLLSEGPLFRVKRFKGRNPTLDTWTEMNANICRQLNVTYIDMYTPFKKSIPLFWLFYKWYVTADGEHGNSRGSAIIAEKIAESVGDWLKAKQY